MVNVELKMGAGELNVRGGSPKLMDAEFHYNRPGLKPRVRYDSSGSRGHLVVEQPSHGPNKEYDYRWDVRLNDEKPIDLQVDFGAGEGHLDVGSLTLRSLEVHMGVGQLRVDLRGTPKNDYNVSVHGGVGEATIYLPSGVGVIADAKGGIGGVNARGLEKRDDRYVNEEYGHAKTTIRLDVRGGIGAINLIGG
jgi:predicted membrane protein